MANYGDILAGLRIDNIAVKHVFLFCVSDVTFTTPNSPRCSALGQYLRQLQGRVCAQGKPTENVRDLKAHSKARTPLTMIAKKMKRTEGRFGERREFSASVWDIAAIAADRARCRFLLGDPASACPRAPPSAGRLRHAVT